MSEFQGLYDVRDMKDDDISFVLSTFVRGLYYGNSWLSDVPKDIYMNNYPRLVEALLGSPNAVVKIACLKEDPDVIIAYSVLSLDFQTVHWVYCKKKWRNKGIATSLLPKYPRYATHLTDAGRSLMKKYDGLAFNPFIGM